MISLTVVVDDGASSRLTELSTSELDESRRQLVDEAMSVVLQGVVRTNPVDTGRSRSAWVRALEAVGGEAPSGWRGPHPDAGAIARGATLGRVERIEGISRDELRATNAVRYIRYLEYGTSKMRAFAMVRRSLAQVVPRIRGMFAFPPESDNG